MVLTLKSPFPNSYVVAIDHDAHPFTNCDSLTNDFVWNFGFLKLMRENNRMLIRGFVELTNMRSFQLKMCLKNGGSLKVMININP
jgi:hypothetical protein